MTVSDKRYKLRALMTSSKFIVKIGFDVSKKMSKNVLKNPGRASDITTNIVSAAASSNTKQTFSALPALIIFYITGKGFDLGKFV